ncbi:SDR family NAD(P)-dependent oxidoreductase [Nocardioides sp. URHA0032]|jgi:NAD(P)-dependent dehydrogenase (short-subunit alcohol dehydrogenase family)|uniref:SDR family NAD(P)-dependent oxidoreductase n=1 Tax=Nocardioides sp. URHA0032 TaxID=1380388 RepID=UPI00048F06F5|nr:SDR family oxidoreductase [Nocardioides sp. URHA0032]
MNAPRVAAITGASHGIGAALVDAYLDLGYAVVANSRSIAPQSTATLETVAGDVGDPALARDVVDAAMGRFGRLDTLVNNAGIFIAGPFEDITDEDYRTVMRTNVDGFFHLTRAAVVQMLAQGAGGHVVNLTSTLVESASSAVPSALTALSKGGIAAATRSLAIEYAGHGIRVNAVSLGVIETSTFSAETHQLLDRQHPIGTTGRITDVTRGVVYLEQSPFVTGEILHIDGGQSAGH